MNDEEARQGLPDTQPITCSHSSPERGRSWDGDERDRARRLITFADGMEAVADGDENGWLAIARRMRVVARDSLRLADSLDAERSARQAIQQQRDECLRLLANQAGKAAA